jgi:tape measure domain-containing protein
MADASKNLEIVISARDEASKVIKGVGGAFSSLVEKSTGASFVFAGALALTGKRIIDIASDMQQNKVAFDTMLGSTEKASRSLRELSDFAKSTPFTFPQVVEASRRLLAYNVEAKDLIPTLKNLGDISAGIGTDKLPQLILAFGQVKAAGHLTGMELRQFSEAGVPLLDILAKQAHVTAGAMSEMITDKAVGFDDVQKALESMTDKGGKFFNLMNKQSKTFSGITSNMSDQLTRIALNIAGISTEASSFGEVVQGGAFDQLSQGAQKLLDMLNALEPKVKGLLGWFVTNQVAIAAALGVIAGGLIGAAAAMWAFLSPVLLLMLAGAELGIQLALIAQNVQKAGKELEALGQMATQTLTWLATNVPLMITNIITWFQQLPDKAGAFLMKLFLDDIPYAVGFAAGWLVANVPVMVQNVITWFDMLPGRVFAIFSQVATFIIAKMTEAIAWLSVQLSALPGKVMSWIAAIPGIVLGIFNQSKDNAVGAMKTMFDLVNGWWGKIKDIFDSIVSAAGRAIDAAQRGFNAGKGVTSHQHGGFIPGSFDQAVPAILHGGERIIPRNGVDVNPAPSGGGSGMSINFSGPVYMDSDDRVSELADKIIRVIGRQNELAGKGIGV